MSTKVISHLSEDLASLLFELGPRKAVIVEGVTDSTIFQTWYPEKDFGDRLTIRPCRKEGGGKRCVKSRLEEVRKFGETFGMDIPVYGIIDRDFCDDATVQVSLDTPEERLFILSRYCIENYVLEPGLVHRELEKSQSKIPVLDQTSMAEEMLEICRKLKTRMAIHWVFIEASENESASATFFPEGQDLEERKETIRQAMGKQKFCDEDEFQRRIQEKEERIEQSLTTLDSAHKYTDGKHLLAQIRRYYKPGLNNDDVFRNHLVSEVKTAGIHQDIRDIIERRILGRKL
jgi:hypothetical protein